jgi:hypothetical protein
MLSVRVFFEKYVSRLDKKRNTWVRNECGVEESIISKYKNGVMVWACGEDG